MSLRDSRDNATIALWRWDTAVDRADDEAEQEERAMRLSYQAPILAYRNRGAYFLRRARWLSTPAPLGRPKAGETRPARPHDVAKARRSALRNARKWYATAARYVRLTKVPRPVPVSIAGSRAMTGC